MLTLVVLLQEHGLGLGQGEEGGAGESAGGGEEPGEDRQGQPGRPGQWRLNDGLHRGLVRVNPVRQSQI